MADEKDQLALRFDQRFLDRHAGSIVSDPVTAIVELVANAWDAGAQKVSITWPTSEVAFSITDDGAGMTPSEFRHRWRTIDYNRRSEQGGKIRMNDGSIRHVFGHNGRGRHAALYFGESYIVRTCKDGTRSSWRVRRGESQPLEIELLGEEEASGKGTTIQADAASGIVLRPDDARTEIGLRFLADPAFQVSLNGEEIRFDDLPDANVTREVLAVDGVGEVTVLMLDTQKTDRTSKQHGIAWRVGSRLVGECDWRDFGDQAFLDGRRRAAKRYTFVVLADALAESDAIKPDWSGFKRSHPDWLAVRETVHAFIVRKLLEETKEERDATATKVREHHEDRVRQLPPTQREMWNSFLDKVLEKCPSLTEREVSDLAGILVNLELAGSKYNLVRRLGALNTADLEDLDQVLSDWTVGMAKVVLDEVAARLALLQELQAKTDDPSTDEVQELQPLFEKGLWIFGPEFETIHFTSNRGMTNVIKNLFGAEGAKGSLNRPDFAITVDGTVGLYTYPEFDDEGGEVGVARLVILELKRPGIPISTDQKDQAWRYVKELRKKGHLTERTQVTCFVLGSEVDSVEAHPRKEWHDRVVITPLLFDRVLKRAHSRTFKLFEKVQDAPFLNDEQRQAWEDFVNGDRQKELPFGVTARSS